MSAPGAYHVPLIVVGHYGGLYEVLQGGAHQVEREVRFEARAKCHPVIYFPVIGGATQRGL